MPLSKQPQGGGPMAGAGCVELQPQLSLSTEALGGASLPGLSGCLEGELGPTEARQGGSTWAAPHHHQDTAGGRGRIPRLEPCSFASRANPTATRTGLGRHSRLSSCVGCGPVSGSGVMCWVVPHRQALHAPRPIRNIWSRWAGHTRLQSPSASSSHRDSQGHTAPA